MIAVIGAGPAGMMAAISAAEQGSEVTLIEKNHRVGKKLSITGKGRCNITNACATEEIFENIPTNNRFLYSAIYGFTNFDTIDFFESLGVPTKVERGERVFPQSDNADDVVQALRKRMQYLGVKIVHDDAVELEVRNGSIMGVRTRNGFFYCDCAILATGGKSYPQTGSDGSGYVMAEKVGHTISEILPSLVPLETKEDTSILMGLSLKNVKVTLKSGGKKIYDDFGEMLFTHFGLSGPLILSSSSHMGKEPEGTEIVIDLKPALTEEMLDDRILRDFSKFINKNFENSLCELLPHKMIDYVVEKTGISPYKKVNEITKEERKKLLDTIKNLTFTVKSYRPVDEAIVTSGGVNVKEINASTMESRIVQNLYFAGEVIDVDAYTGGFNLQIAFSTGRLAGLSASQKEKNND